MPRYAPFVQGRTKSFPVAVSVTDSDTTEQEEAVQQQIIVNVDLHCDRSWVMAVKSAAVIDMLKVSYVSPARRLVVTGVGVEAVRLINLLRRMISRAELLTIEDIEGICRNPAPSMDQPIGCEGILAPFVLLLRRKMAKLSRRLQVDVPEPTIEIEGNLNEHEQLPLLTQPSQLLAVDHQDNDHYQVSEEQVSYLGQQSNGTEDISIAASGFANSCKPTHMIEDAKVTESQIFPNLWNPSQVSEGNNLGLPVDDPDHSQTLDEQVPYLGQESNREEDISISTLGCTDSSKQKEDFPTQNNPGSSSFKSWSQISSSSPLEHQGWTSNHGKRRVKPPEEVFFEGYSLWENSIVGHLVNHESLTLNIVNSWAQTSWGDFNLLSVFKLTNRFYLFKFRYLSGCSKVLDLSPWDVAGKFMVLRKWQPNINLSGKYLSTMPLWVKLYNVPLELWTRVGLSYVASAIGKPLDLDESTASRSRLTYARVYVEISATDDIPCSFDLELPNGDTIEIQVAFPWKPEMCRVCKLFGHNDNTCKVSI